MGYLFHLLMRSLVQRIVFLLFHSTHSLGLCYVPTRLKLINIIDGLRWHCWSNFSLLLFTGINHESAKQANFL